jgi:hypothetical protein
MSNFVHLAKRAVGSFSNGEPKDISVAQIILNKGEFEFWNSMQGRDKCHSLVVLDRFDAACTNASQEERAAALLHDVGKRFADLGWLGRIVATIIGPRGFRFHLYHDHENLGAQLISEVSTQRTINLVAGIVTDDVAIALRIADDI